MTREVKDYYEILGVSPDATCAEIKRAYRKLARTHHPDVARNPRDAEERFKRINEANDVLSDPSKRRDYDRQHAWRARCGRSSPAPDTMDSRRRPHRFEDDRSRDFGPYFRVEEWSDGLDHSCHSAAGRWPGAEEHCGPREQHTHVHGPDIEVDILVTPEEAAIGSTRPISFHHSVACGRCQEAAWLDRRSCPECEGSGHVILTRNYRVKIPPGVHEGQRLRLAVKGEFPEAENSRGDLYLRVRLASHPHVTTEDDAPCYLLVLAPWEAMVGTTVALPTPAGKVAIQIPRGTRHGQKLRVRDCGLATRGEKRGDLFIVVKVQVPEKTSPDERAIWERLSR